MGSVLSTPAGLLAAVVLVLASYVLYQRLLPKPIPGIPYNEAAARKLFGDVPEMMGYVMRTQRIFCWLTSLTTRHGSAITQAFIKPFGARPWVIVTDPGESQDILLRRTREFDRSGFFGELIGGILPEQHIQFLSADARFRDNRNLINHLMAPSFIAAVSAPEVYRSVETLVKVWQAKCDRAGARPFSAHLDLKYAALDAIFASSFGLPEAESITVRRLDAVAKGATAVPTDADADAPVSFPEGQIPAVFAAVLALEASVMSTQLSPAPALTSWVLRQMPALRRAIATKDAYIRGQVDACARLIEQGHVGDARSALHSVLLRERAVAEKNGRPPAYHSRAIADEFFGFMLAGHDTSATAAAWGVKYLSEHPGVQTRLRDALQAALPRAHGEKRPPTYAELARAAVPYLDAVVEEVLRHANTIAFVVRRALCDAEVLGRTIPRGTDVFLMANGPGYLAPGLPVRDAERSPGARAGRGKALTGLWDDGDIGAFRPERWLATDPATGEETLDPLAGPSLAFGLGPRGCFGKKLALQQLRIQFALLVWHFRLLEVPADLGGHEAVQRFAREPVRCYVRLERVSRR